MSGQHITLFTRRFAIALVPIALVGASASAGSSGPDPETDPMRFFEGKTESLSTIKLIMRAPYRSRTIGDGEIDDGILKLVQRVHEDGKAPYDRRWRVRQLAPGRFTATMSEATGPVRIEEVGGRYRFRFKLKGSVSIEQWLTPLPGGKSARSRLIIRKLGMTVGRSEGTIRKL
ncbi:MAG TPA: hypothetical protein VEB39_06490 [Sphingomicrobium sp.]|nr:hypothetical protein [Sphingomicrobium sp.]